MAAFPRPRVRLACRSPSSAGASALLEERLGVRLIQRSTRRFSVTEIGREFYDRCVAMLVEAEAAEQVIARGAVRAARRDPHGLSDGARLLPVRHADRALHGRKPARRDPPRKHQPPRGRDRRRIRHRDPRPLSAARAHRPRHAQARREHGSALSRALRCSAGAARLPIPPISTAMPSLDLGPPQRDHVWRLERATGEQRGDRARVRGSSPTTWRRCGRQRSKGSASCNCRP